MRYTGRMKKGLLCNRVWGFRSTDLGFEGTEDLVVSQIRGPQERP